MIVAVAGRPGGPALPRAARPAQPRLLGERLRTARAVAPGLFSVYIATATDKVEQAKTGLLEQLAQLLEAAPADDEFARAKRHLSGGFAIDQQRNAARAAHASLDALYGLGPEASLGYAESIESVTKEDLLRVARRVLRLDAYTISIVGEVDEV